MGEGLNNVQPEAISEGLPHRVSEGMRMPMFSYRMDKSPCLTLNMVILNAEDCNFFCLSMLYA